MKYTSKLILNGTEYEFGAENGWQPGANTIAYYPFTTSAQATDYSTNHNDGTIVGNITFGTNLGVDCAYFPGSNNYVQVPHDSSMETSSIAISCWCAIESGYNSNNGGIIYKGPFDNHIGIYQLANFSNLTWRIREQSGGQIAGNGFSGDQVWTHIYVDFDGTTLNVYINGQLLDTSNYNHSITGNTNNLYIGAYYTSEYALNGYLSNLIIENQCRTEQEIQDYFNQTKSLYGIS